MGTGWPFGMVVIAGRPFTITRLALRGGHLKITAAATAPRDWPAVTAPATIYGADGQGIGQGWLVPIPAVPKGQHVQVELPLRLDRIELAEGPD